MSTQHPLVDRPAIGDPPSDYLHAIGRVFAEFGEHTQDSGNVSYGVEIAGERFFVKTAGDPDDARWYLPHGERVHLLRNAARLAESVEHRAVPKLHRTIDSPHGPMLVYDWADGELVGAPATQRDDPASAFQRFRHLPAQAILRCLDVVFDLHEKLAAAGWIAVDFYDGSLIYDFAGGRLHVVDLDSYHAGAFRNEMGRMFGSSRFMAPEEHERGALIDERTNVFTMGRAALVLLGNGTSDRSAFRGTRETYAVVAKACEPTRSKRFGSLAEFNAAWLAAGR